MIDRAYKIIKIRTKIKIILITTHTGYIKNNNNMLITNNFKSIFIPEGLYVLAH